MPGERRLHLCISPIGSVTTASMLDMRQGQRDDFSLSLWASSGFFLYSCIYSTCLFSLPPPASPSLWASCGNMCMVVVCKEAFGLLLCCQILPLTYYRSCQGSRRTHKVYITHKYRPITP